MRSGKPRSARSHHQSRSRYRPSRALPLPLCVRSRRLSVRSCCCPAILADLGQWEPTTSSPLRAGDDVKFGLFPFWPFRLWRRRHIFRRDAKLNENVPNLTADDFPDVHGRNVLREQFHRPGVAPLLICKLSATVTAIERQRSPWGNLDHSLTVLTPHPARSSLLRFSRHALALSCNLRVHFTGRAHFAQINEAGSPSGRVESSFAKAQTRLARRLG
jgi:hypothetical protein